MPFLNKGTFDNNSGAHYTPTGSHGNYSFIFVFDNAFSIRSS